MFKHDLTLILILSKIFAALYLFLNGFLLTRHVVLKNSSDEFRPNVSTYPKIILVIIDGLRYDFLISENGFLNEQHFPKLKALYEERCENIFISKLFADAPTTTMQRLKAITTGSLPTFIDIGKNFVSSKIFEDNFVFRFVETNKSIIFMGDDTWMSLFPHSFTRAYPFPSFDVFDLDTVDNGIIENIYKELNRNDWSLLIAHFLGVDHCGHRFHAKHPEMLRKLNHMDDTIRKIIDHVDEGEILLVIGDHGMTNDGGHGGESTNEVSSAILAFSKHLQLACSPSLEPGLNQIDLTSTICLLNGLSVPFSNLGSCISSLFLDNEVLQQAMELVTLQMKTYVTAYLEDYEDHALRSKISKLRSYLPTNSYNVSIEEHKKYHSLLLDVFRQSWIVFDVRKMLFGLISLLFVSSILLHVSFASTYLAWDVFRILLSFAYLVVHFYPFDRFFLFLLFVYLIFSYRSIIHSFKFISASLFPLFILIMDWLSSFSNSYIISAPSALRFFLSLLILSECFCVPFSLHFLYSSIWLIIIRFSSRFWICREESLLHDCIDIYDDNFMPFSLLLVFIPLLIFLFFFKCKFARHKTIFLFLLPLTFFFHSPLISSSLCFLTFGAYFIFIIDENFSIYNLMCFMLFFTSILIFFISSISVAPAIFLMTSLLTTWLYVKKSETHRSSVHTNTISAGQPCSRDDMYVYFMARYFFYATGHQPVFSLIQWKSAFRFDKLLFGIKVPDFVRFVLILHQTFSADILISYAFICKVLKESFLMFRKCLEIEHVLPKNAERFYEFLIRRLLQYTVLITFKIFFVVLSTAILRRHLMLWSIFCPYLIFELFSFTLTVFTFLISVILVRFNLNWKNFV